jgi:hypothetical protein
MQEKGKEGKQSSVGIDAYSSPTQSSVYTSLETKIPFFFRELFFYIGYIISLPFR